MSEAVTLVVRDIGALVTCDPAHGDPPGVVRDAVLMSTGELITYAGPRSGAPFPPMSAKVLDVDAHGAAVIPGFVDAHTHIAWLGDRADEYALRSSGVSYERIAHQGGGIRSTVRSTAEGTTDALRDAAAGRAWRMLEHGTTTVEVKSGYGLDHEAEMRQLDAALALAAYDDLPHVVTTYLPLHAPPEGDRRAFIADVCERGVVEAAPRASFCDVFCEAGAFTVEECEFVLRAGRRVGLSPKVHAEQRTHSGGALLAARMRAASADHLEHATDDDLRALAAAGVPGVMLPGAALVLGGPPPPAGRLRDAGGTVAIATDCNPGTSYSESMPLMMSLAVATAGLSAAQALVAATAGGAAALEMPDRGILRRGMRCDAAILATRGWVDIAYHLGANPVRTVIRGGLVVAGGEEPVPWPSEPPQSRRRGGRV